MDNLLEILVPVIFAAIYFFGNMFSGKSDKDESAPDSPRRREQDPDAAERQRRIQEDIRRKIMERRGQGKAASEGTQSSGPSSRQPDMQGTPSVRTARPEPAARAPRQQASPDARAPQKPSFNWDTSEGADEKQMEERLERIEATKRQAAQLREKAGPSHDEAAGTQADIYSQQVDDRIGRSEVGEHSRTSGRRSGLQSAGRSSRSRRARSAGMSDRARGSRRSVRSTLTDPKAARTAFIHSEVLGVPVSQQKASTVPGLR